MANVPSFRFSFRGNIRRNHPFGNHPFANHQKGSLVRKRAVSKRAVLANVPSFRYPRSGGTSRHRQVTDLDVTVLGFFGPRIAFPATGALRRGRATPFFYHFSVHLSSVLGRTELCHEVWTPGPPKPQIINNENHHLALLEETCERRESQG